MCENSGTLLLLWLLLGFGCSEWPFLFFVFCIPAFQGSSWFTSLSVVFYAMFAEAYLQLIQVLGSVYSVNVSMSFSKFTNKPISSGFTIKNLKHLLIHHAEVNNKFYSYSLYQKVIIKSLVLWKANR